MKTNKAGLGNKDLLNLLPIFLVSLVFIIGGSYFSSPPLRSDDWNWIVWPTVFDPLKIINFADRRPLFSALLSIMSSIFGLQIQWYYIFNWFLLFLSGVVVYFICKKAFPNHAWLALPVALVFLIYPVNYARTWLVTLVNTYALLLALLSILLMLIYRASGKFHHIVLANILFLVSLLTYEAGFGIVMLAALLMIILTREKRRWSFVSVLIIGIAFLIWRGLIQPYYLNIQDFYLQKTDLNFFAVVSDYAQALFIFMFNWVGLLLIPFGDLKYWVFVGFCLLILLMLLVFITVKTRKLRSNSPRLLADEVKGIKPLLKISLLGGLFWFAGYIPVIFLWQPSFYGDLSRVNFAAIMGAALALVSLIAAVVVFLSKQAGPQRKTLWIVLIPLIILGMVSQVHSQKQRIKVWEINKTLWREMFKAVPNIKSGTKLVIVIPRYQDVQPFEMLPFRGDWEAESALDVLYNNPDLFAEYYYLDNPQMPDNWIPVSGDYSEFLFVYFDTETGLLSVIQNPETALQLTIQMESYVPENRIVEQLPEVGEYRWLVD